jgi:predicted nucleotidyltransferase
MIIITTIEVINMTLIDLLEKEKNIRKIFGKKEIIIIKKQLLGINLTQSEKNRLSRDIRKKFEAIKKISEYDFDIKIKKGEIIKRKIEEMKEDILNSEYRNKIKKIVLFGSTVENKRTFRSDIDIAVELFKIDKKEEIKFKLKFNQYDNVQVSIYNSLPNKIKDEINKKGKIIYEKQNN